MKFCLRSWKQNFKSKSNFLLWKQVCLLSHRLYNNLGRLENVALKPFCWSFWAISKLKLSSSRQHEIKKNVFYLTSFILVWTPFPHFDMKPFSSLMIGHYIWHSCIPKRYQPTLSFSFTHPNHTRTHSPMHAHSHARTYSPNLPPTHFAPTWNRRHPSF